MTTRPRWPSPCEAGKTQGQPSRTGCAVMSSKAFFPIGRSCAPLLVSSKRMQPARPSTHARRSARHSIRRKPVSNSKRVAARAVAFPPFASVFADRLAELCHFFECQESSLFTIRGLFTPRAGFSLISLRDFLAYSRIVTVIPNVRAATPAPPVATPPRPSAFRGLAVLPAMMSAFIRSISAVVRLRTVNRPMRGFTCVSILLMSDAQVDALIRPLDPATYKSHNSETVRARRTA